MTFEEVLDEAVAMLQRQGRVSYRALKRQFDLDDDYLEDVKNEIIEVHRLAIDQDGRMLVWTGDAEPAPPPAQADERLPLVYTPQHLAEKILTTRHALHGERKQVTVLFCDLANSTGLAEQLGAETMHTVLNQFFELALRAVHRYEGTINQFLGDGFMALFGAPIAHEDHARRAILAALDLRRELYAYHASQDRSQSVELTIRIGLNTGMVVVGAIGDNLRMDYTAVGDTTNVAARLEQEASPNQVVISEATHRLVSGYCTTRALGTISLKGKTEPIAAWEVISAQPARTRLEVESERGLTPFVGRGGDLRTLHDRFAQAQAGHGQVVFLVGEAGIGKSRLLLEFRKELSKTDATWLEGHALSFGQTMAFHPMIDLLKRNFRIEEGDTEPTIITKIERGVLLLGGELRPVLPYVRHLLAVDPGDETVRMMDPQLRRGELFAALRRLLLRAAEARPQVVVFEDLHWMDQATEALLVATVDGIPTSRIFLLCTYRPGYQHPLGDQTYHTRMALTNLSTIDSVQMAQAVLNSVSLPESLETLIVQKAEGNPFFVEEVVKSLQEMGALQQAGDRYILTRAMEEIEVPDTIQDVLMARIDRLDEAPKQTLQLAAVIGREFTRRLLDRLTDIQERNETYLRALKGLELIHEKALFPELAYMFKHALTQDVAYHSLLEQRRQELHGLIGRAIEEIYAGRLTEHYEVLAYHFAKAKEWSQALEYLLKAAEKAVQAFATREALALYDEALRATEILGQAVDVQTVMAIHQKKAELFFLLSDFERSRIEGERRLVLAQQAGDRISEGAALAEMGFASTYDHDLNQGLHYARRAIEVAQQVDAKSILASGHYITALIQVVRGQLGPAKEEIDQALANSQTVGDVTRQSHSLYFLGQMKRWEGSYVEALSLLTESFQLAQNANLLHICLQCLFCQGLTLTDMGNYDGALAALDEGVSLSEKVGNEVIYYRLLNSLAWVYSECRHLDRALNLNQQSTEAARKRNDPEIVANAEINLSDVFLAQGDLALAQKYLDGVHRLVNDPTTSDWMKWRYSIHLFASLGELWLVRGDTAKAQEFTDQCLEIATRTNSRKYVVKGWRLQGEIALAQRQWEDAEGWLRQALSLAQAVGNPTQIWKTHVAMGWLHTAVQQPERAQQAYQAARDVIEHIKMRLSHPELRASLEGSPLIQDIYELSMPD